MSTTIIELVPKEPSAPAVVDDANWHRCHVRAQRATIAAVVYVALEGIELLKLQRRHKPTGTWMEWLSQNYPLSHESARMRVNLGEVLEERFVAAAVEANTEQLADIEWFLGLASAEEELDETSTQRAGAVIAHIAPAATARQLFLECGVLALPPKPEPKPPREPRAPRPKPEPWVRVGNSFAKLPDDQKLKWIEENFGLIRELLSRLAQQAPAQAVATTVGEDTTETEL